MIDLALDPTTGDLDLSTYDLQTVEGAAQVRQQLEMRLRTLRGECLLEADFGVPYLQDIFKKNPDLTLVEGIFKEQIIGIPGVNRIISLTSSLEKQTRRWSLEFKVDTIYGVVDYVGTV